MWLVDGIDGCGLNVYVRVVGIVVRRYIYILIVFPTPLVLALFCEQHPYFFVFPLFFLYI